MSRLLRRFAAAADHLARGAGHVAAALQPILVAVLIANVVLRYGLGRGFIELEELQWHLYAASFLLAFAEVCARDEHVRVDLLRARLSARARAWIDFLGNLLLLLPFTLILSSWAFDFFWRSWRVGERSSMPSGLPARWIIKGVLLISLVLLATQALAQAARNLARLLGETAPEERSKAPPTLP